MSFDNSDRLLTKEDCQRVERQVKSCSNGKGNVFGTVRSWWNRETRWARNRMALASDRRSVGFSVLRIIDGRKTSVFSTQIDDETIRVMVEMAERQSNMSPSLREDMSVPEPVFPKLPSAIVWSDNTYNLKTETAGRIANELMDAAEARDMRSAGYLEVRGTHLFQFSDSTTTDTLFTSAQCSMTVRHPKGVASGWAGLSSYDWSAIDGRQLAKTALDKCVASVNPVRIEPGRYTVVLEPQATHEMVYQLTKQFSRYNAEISGEGPFYLEKEENLGIFRSKLGLQVLDERITISHDPSDPQTGVLYADALKEITLIDKGVLTALEYGRGYGLPYINNNRDEYSRPSYRMTGGSASIEDMILSTRRGLLVSRLSNVILVDRSSIMCTGVTRDGLWLIENGKLSKAVHNMRFTESPMVMLNQVDTLGVPVPVFMPVPTPYSYLLTPAIVPSVKANNFSFTSLSDAI